MYYYSIIIVIIIIIIIIIVIVIVIVTYSYWFISSVVKAARILPPYLLQAIGDQNGQSKGFGKLFFFSHE